MANCRVLSREMQRLMGKKLSAITLFRMLYPEKYGVRPYSYSLDMLQDFISLVEERSTTNAKVVGSELYLSRSVPEETALYNLLRLNLTKSETELCLGFFEDLPMDHLALGWERHIIGKSLGDWFQDYKDRDFQVDKMKLLLGLPQIRTYYFETYVDYNNGLAVYGRGMEEMLQRQGAGDPSALKRSIAGADSAWLTSALFGYLMLHHFAYLSLDEGRRVGYRNILHDPVVEDFLPHISLVAPFVYIRSLAFTAIEEAGQGAPLTKYHLEEWLDVLNGCFGKERPWERDFAAVILFDLLVVLCERRLLEHLLLALPPQPDCEEVVQPVYIRARLYRALCSGESNEQVMDIAHTPYALGDGETAYHRLLMDRAMYLFDRQFLSAEEKQALISQTGFIRFS